MSSFHYCYSSVLINFYPTFWRCQNTLSRCSCLILFGKILFIFRYFSVVNVVTGWYPFKLNRILSLILWLDVTG